MEMIVIKLSVMTFNLRQNTPVDGINAWPYRIDKVTQIITSNKPNLIGTQEGLYSMLNDIQKELPQYGMIGNGREGDRKDEHCAIFYNKDMLKLLNHDQFWLSETPDKVNSISWNSAYSRICTWGTFCFLNHPSKEFVVFNTHLDHVSEEAKEKGIQLIWSKMQTVIQEGYPVILTGDMNATPKSKTIQFLRGEITLDGINVNLTDSYTTLDQLPGATSHQFTGTIDGEPIDYIFTSKNIKVENTKIDRSIFDGHYPSDHYPVITELTI